MATEIKIYIADLAAYNAGYLHGAWIDATLDITDIQEKIREILNTSPVEDAEEYAIHDYEGFGGYNLGEYAGLETAHKIACFLEEHGEIAADLLAHFCGDMDEAQKTIEDNYCGCYSSVADFAEELTEQSTDIPKNLKFYIDYDRMARDMDMSGDIFSIETAHDEVHIFWSH